MCYLGSHVLKCCASATFFHLQVCSYISALYTFYPLRDRSLIKYGERGGGATKRAYHKKCVRVGGGGTLAERRGAQQVLNLV